MMQTPETFIFILAGGSGERFWPLSRRQTPKQLLSLFSNQTLLGDTVERVKSLVPAERIFILTNIQQKEATLNTLPHFPAKQLIVEPAKRDTAPAAALATAVAYSHNPNAVVVLLPADQMIKNTAALHKNIRDAVQLASQNDSLITLAIPPTFPSTGFGYLKLNPIAHQEKAKATIFHQVEQFVEKPSLDKAKEYLASGDYSWNAGMFIWKAASFYKETQRLAPELAGFIEKFPTNDPTPYIKKHFPTLPKISVDYAIMEKATSVIAAQAEFDWDDVGSWTSLSTHLPQDQHGNTIRGKAALHEAKGNIIVSGSKHIALCGVSDLVVVETGDTVMVCHKNSVQDIKKLLSQLPEQLL